GKGAGSAIPFDTHISRFDVYGLYISPSCEPRYGNTVTCNARRKHVPARCPWLRNSALGEHGHGTAGAKYATCADQPPARDKSVYLTLRSSKSSFYLSGCCWGSSTHPDRSLGHWRYTRRWYHQTRCQWCRWHHGLPGN